MNRRDLLRLGALGTAAALLPREAEALLLNAAKPKRLRIAHLTDVHVFKNATAQKGFAAALKRVYELRDKPDLILIGGDCVMNADAISTAEAEKQWAEWRAILRDYDRIPLRPVLGNHDYHWRATPTGEPLAQREEGAKWAIEELGLPGRYSTFDRNGWRFLLLDSVWWDQKKYRAELDGPQMEWLKATLTATPKTMPVVVSSHISVFSACGFIERSADKEGSWVIPKSWMHADAIALKDLFKAHGNVRLALSGHMHQLDDIKINGTRYLCAGAVSGAWWAGRHYDTDAGFTVLDLHPDGRTEAEYVRYAGGASIKL